MKKQVTYQGKLFDLSLDEKNNLTLIESIQKIQNDYCTAYYCKSGRLKKWKIEFNKSFINKINKTLHIKWVKNDAEAQLICDNINNILNNSLNNTSKKTIKTKTTKNNRKWKLN